MPDFMWDVCFYTWLMKCNTCVMFHSDKFLNSCSQNNIFICSPCVSFSDNGSGSGEGGEYQTQVTLPFGLAFLLYVYWFYVPGCCIPHELRKNYDNLKISFNIATLSDDLRTVFV